jgi:hypothetical protein
MTLRIEPLFVGILRVTGIEDPDGFYYLGEELSMCHRRGTTPALIPTHLIERDSWDDAIKISKIPESHKIEVLEQPTEYGMRYAVVAFPKGP